MWILQGNHVDFRRKNVDFMSKKGGHDMTCIFSIGQVGDMSQNT